MTTMMTFIDNIYHSSMFIIVDKLHGTKDQQTEKFFGFAQASKALYSVLTRKR